MFPSSLFPWRFLFLLAAVSSLFLHAQPYGQADRSEPGDVMIQQYLAAEAAKLDSRFITDIRSAAEWEARVPQFRQEYFEMLGLWPLPEKSELHATTTSTLTHGDVRIDLLHYQSRPGLYVTANLYRPANTPAGQKLPAILYVCGHSHRGRDGNKTAFQSHGLWLARHGYVCLMVDTLQLGEIPGVHHGTYREQRWWWLARGYTPAGVEAWNGIRAIDYLLTRPDVDPERIAITGISGGGAATFWIAAADERVKVAVPVSGMADLDSYVGNRVINGHCDCMFFYNTHQWPWTRIAGLVAPRPMLFVNSDQDPIFPMDANERVINRLERLYSLFGQGDLVDALVSVGGHDYRRDIHQGVFRFLNTHLKNDPRPVLDSEIDLVTGNRPDQHPIAPEKLRVFPKDSDIPKDAINGKVDSEFVPIGQLSPSITPAQRDEALSKLQRFTFNHFPERVPPARPSERPKGNPVSDVPNGQWLGTEEGITIRLRAERNPESPHNIYLVVTGPTLSGGMLDWIGRSTQPGDALHILEPRGAGATAWTRKNPPNYVERSHYLLGRTADSGRVWDIAATARYLCGGSPSRKVYLVAEKSSAVLAIYAAALEKDIAGLILFNPPESLMDPGAPALLNALRVCDLPETLGLLAPRPVLLHARESSPLAQRARTFYEAAGAGSQFKTEL